MKKIGIIFILLIIAIVTTIAIIFTIKPINKDNIIIEPKIEITLAEDLTLEFLEEKHVSDFIASINGTIIDDYIIDSTEIGEKQIDFSFINDENLKANYSFIITIKDTVPPLIWLGDSYSITVGNDVDLISDITCGDNEDDNPIRTIIGDYDFNTIGSYPLKFVATDRSGNTSEQDFTLYVNSKSKSSNINKTRTYTYFADVIKNYKTDKTKIGIDVSSWQEDIDFDAIKKAGVEFIIIRVGSKRGTNGEYFVDSQFVNNIKKANEYGIDAGLYFYSYAASIEEAKKDAEWLLEQIKGYEINLPIAFDWEDWGNYNKYHLSFWKLTSMANAYIETIEEHGYTGMLYGSLNYLKYFWLPNKHITWLAHYAKQTTYEKDYMFWQICENGQINGIYGDVDIDIMYIK